MPSKIAVLVDAENVSYREAPRILEEASRLGEIIVKAVYGNWQHPGLQKWQEAAEQQHFKIRHHTRNAKTKNSSDMQLIMDAMDVLHHTTIDTFCLVTNDADYVALLDKLHEYQRYVVGLGYKNAAETLIRACDQFIFIGNGETPPESLVTPALSVLASPPLPPIPTPAPVDEPVIIRPIPPKLITQAFSHCPQDAQGWVSLSALGSALRQLKPGFQSSNYGHSTLTKLLQNVPELVELQINGVSRARLRQHDTKPEKSPEKLPGLVKKAFNKVPTNTNGWVTLSALGSALHQLEPGFKSNNYGHATLAKLLQNLPSLVELREDNSGKSARLKP